jgi:RNA polymerase sigma-70 factor (ECF subfamily)
MSQKRPDGPEQPAPAQATSLSLLERARANDGDAWARVVALYAPLVRLWCGRAGLAAEDAEDVAQEVFASAAAHLGTFRRDRPGDTFRGWLRVITRNAALAQLRKGGGRGRGEGGSEAWQRLQEVADPLAGAPEEETAEVDRLYRRAVEQVRGEFVEKTWQAFWLTVIEGRSAAALAGELGVSAAAVRQSRSRVLRRLKQELGDLLD